MVIFAKFDSLFRYLVFTSKHHDGYANFNSSYSFGWNSMSVGANRNVLKELKDAFHAQDPDFHFGLYYSLFEWFNPLYLKDKSGDFASRDFVQNKIIPEMKELALNIEPHVWWSDGDWEATPDYWGWVINPRHSKSNFLTFYTLFQINRFLSLALQRQVTTY